MPTTTPPSIDYFFAPHSPWTYLGHARFCAIAQAHGATVRVRPVNLATVFPATGGVPLGQRAPQRQAYRLTELARYSEALGLPLHLQPRHFPVSPDAAARLIITVDRHDGSAAALDLAGAVLRAVWAEQRDIADLSELSRLLDAQDLAQERLAQSQEPGAQQTYDDFSREAIEAGVFGAPSYVIDGEIFWGQDRLDMLQRRLQRGS